MTADRKPTPGREAEGRTASRRCPNCSKPADAAFRPFCSKRCADADLGRWLTGAYAVPGEPAPPGSVPPEPGDPD